MLLYVTSLKGKACTVICDILFFDGVTNVENAGWILASRYLRISDGNRSEHVVALFFPAVFYKIPAYESLLNFTKRLRNILVSTRYPTTAMFNK